MNTPTPGTPAPSGPSLTRLLGYLAADPGNERLRADIFDLALAQGQFDTAQDQATWLLSRSPADYAWRHRLVLLDMARQEWEEARLLLQSLIAEGQRDPVLTYNLAYIDHVQGRPEDAIARLGPLVDGDAPRVPEALALMLRCLHLAGRIDDGVALFERHLDKNPPPAAWGAASLLALDGNRAELVHGWADRALASDPLQHEALVAKGTMLLGVRDTNGALQHLQTALQRHPRDGRTWSAIGMAHLLALALEPALDAFRRAVESMPAHIGTWHGMGWCQILRRDLPAARRAFESALALDRTFGESHGAVAVVLALEGRATEAEEAIRRAVKLDPSNLSARYAGAVLSGEAKDTERFARLARAALGQHRSADGKSLADVVLARR
jgi:tetratricopeptide (TPR) repeat protein